MVPAASTSTCTVRAIAVVDEGQVEAGQARHA
jgi:hypothetical protein